MSRDAFLSEALNEADKLLEKFAFSSLQCHGSVRVYKMADRAYGEPKMYVLFCYFA